jgi:hypothetical protein
VQCSKYPHDGIWQRAVLGSNETTLTPTAENVIVTSPGRNYTYQTVLYIAAKDSIVFTARGVRDARILLSSDDAAEPIEIVIGGSHNPANGSSVSMIRWGVQPTSNATLERPDLIGATYTDPSGILSPDEDRFFWIYWSEQVVGVGKVRRSGPLCG